MSCGRRVSLRGQNNMQVERGQFSAETAERERGQTNGAGTTESGTVFVLA